MKILSLTVQILVTQTFKKHKKLYLKKLYIFRNILKEVVNKTEIIYNRKKERGKKVTEKNLKITLI